MRKLIFFLYILISFPAFAFWGERGEGIIDSIYSPDTAPHVYLTLDACGSKDDGYDKELIDFLRAEKIKATLFINARWIDKNPDIFMQLARDPLFKIENHGMRHKPASVSGRTVYKIKGTVSKDDLVYEVNANADKIEKLTGRRPRWFRSGTAYYDGEAINIITKELGYKIAGFAITLDAGATFPAGKVYSQTMLAKSYDILLAHMNRPKGETFEGLKPALLELKAKGFVFDVLPN